MPFFETINVRPRTTFFSSGSHLLHFGAGFPRVRLVHIQDFSITAFITFNTTRLKIYNGSILTRFSCARVCTPVSLNVKGYQVSITTPTQFGSSSLQHTKRIHITAGCPGVAGGCCRTRNVRTRYIGLDNTVRLTPAVKLYDQVISIISSKTALGTGKLIRVKRILSISSQLVVGHNTFGAGATRVAF